MVRDHLSERMKQGGSALLAITDALAMQAQGAMWLFDYGLQDWRYYLVTSLVDTLGRRKTYRLLLEAFERSSFPNDMTVEDVHLGSPIDPLFQLVSTVVRVDNGMVSFENCIINNVPFDGVIYRSVREVPTSKEAASIEKRFAKRVKDLGTHTKQMKGREAQIVD